MSRPRKEPTLKDKLAATLRELFEIPYAHAKLMSAEQILSLAEFHHIIYHTDTADDHHYNLEPMLRADHRERTAKIDLPQIAKTRRLTKAQEDFQRRLMLPRADRPVKKSRIPSRPFSKRRSD